MVMVKHKLLTHQNAGMLYLNFVPPFPPCLTQLQSPNNGPNMFELDILSNSEQLEASSAPLPIYI